MPSMNVYFYSYFNIARDVVTGLLLFLDISHFNHTFLHARIEAHTRKHTCMICAQEQWREPGIGAWFRGAKEGFLRLVTKA